MADAAEPEPEFKSLKERIAACASRTASRRPSLPPRATCAKGVRRASTAGWRPSHAPKLQRHQESGHRSPCPRQTPDTPPPLPRRRSSATPISPYAADTHRAPPEAEDPPPLPHRSSPRRHAPCPLHQGRSRHRYPRRPSQATLPSPGGRHRHCRQPPHERTRPRQTLQPVSVRHA
jgi:hypothetical protein